LKKEVQVNVTKSTHNQQPRVITTDKYAATEVAVYEMISDEILSS
jgi:hypothetical protein